MGLLPGLSWSLSRNLPFYAMWGLVSFPPCHKNTFPSFGSFFIVTREGGGWNNSQHSQSAFSGQASKTP